jgi:hypothetical protein
MPSIPHLQELIHVIRVTLTFIGGSTVIGFLGWLYKRRQENFEDKVLEMFAERQQPWRTADGIHNDYRGKHLKDVPMWVILPTHKTRWDGIKWRLRTIPYQVRHVWRMKFLMPNKKKVERTVLHLWKRGLLVRVNDPKYFRLNCVPHH